MTATASCAVSTDDRPLSLRLREDSQGVHNSAENAGFVTLIMGGKLNREAWLLLLSQYAPIYAALQDVSEELRGKHGNFDELLDPGLDRNASIRSDLDALVELTGHAEYPVLPATENYVARIKRLGDDPARFLAHHYTRYLGDLSGGQVMKRFFGEKYDLPENTLSFFVFDDIKKGPVFKKEYREYVDSLEFTEEQKQAAVSETLDAFAHNEAIFKECLDTWRSEFGEPQA